MNNTREATGPERLLENIGRSIMFKATVISLVAHFVLLAGTSVSLFQDWFTVRETKDANGQTVSERPFFLKAPGTINALKGAERKAADEAKRKAEAAAKAEAEAKAAEEKKAAAEKEKAKAAPATSAAPAAGAEAKADGEKKPPEVQPLPPKKDFELGGDLDLD